MSSAVHTVRWVGALALLVPLVVAPDGMLFAFVAPKVVLLRTIVLAMLPVFVLAWASRPERRFARPSPITLALLAFLASAALSTACGVDPRLGLLDVPNRMLGLWSLVHLVAWYAMMAWASDEATRRRLLHLGLAVTVAVGGVAVAQKFDPSLLINQGNPRVHATLGHATYLGGFGATAAFLGVLVAFTDRSRLARAGGIAAAVAAGTAVLLSETRSGLLALAAGAFTLILFLRLTAASRSRWSSALILAGGATAVAIVVPLLGLEAKITRLEREIERDRATLLLRFAGENGTDVAAIAGPEAPEPAATTLAAIEAFRAAHGSALRPLSGADVRAVAPALLDEANRDRPIRTDGSPERRLERSRLIWSTLYRVPGARRFMRTSVTQKTATTRLAKWDVALAAGRENALLGVGPNAFAYAFDARHDPALLAQGRTETWVDDAHNVVLNAFAEQGTVGVVALLALFGVPLLVLSRAARRGTIDRRGAACLAAAVVAHFVHGQFVFEDASSWVVFLLALLLANQRPPRAAAAASISPTRWHRLGALGAASAGLVALVGIEVPIVRANRATHDAIGSLHRADVDGAKASFLRAESFVSPHRDGDRVAFAQTLVELADRLALALDAANLPNERALVEARRRRLPALAALVHERLGENLALHPLGLRAPLLRARLATMIATLAGDRSRLARANEELRAALERSPRRQEIRFELADVMMAERRPPGEIEPVLRAAIADAPVVGESWLRLARFFALARRPHDVLATIEQARERGATFAPRDAGFAAALEADARRITDERDG